MTLKQNATKQVPPDPESREEGRTGPVPGPAARGAASGAKARLHNQQRRATQNRGANPIPAGHLT
jgi:hypothetical protein